MNHQPDDPGPDTDQFIEPLIFGRKHRHHLDSVTLTIKRNAGKMSKEKIAEAICMSVNFVEQTAFKHRIDLSYPPKVHLEDVEPRGA